MDSTKFYITFLILISVLFSCKNKAPETEVKPPEYTKPGYTITESNSIHTPIQFTDITKEAGIDFIHETGAFGKKWMPETMGSGGGFLDYNNDGLPDIFLVNSSEWTGRETKKKQHTPKLYQNLGKRSRRPSRSTSTQAALVDQAGVRLGSSLLPKTPACAVTSLNFPLSFRSSLLSPTAVK